MGGWRGFTEPILPGLVFVVCFMVTRDIMLMSILSAGTTLIISAARPPQRQSTSQAISGFFGADVGALWALTNGRGESFYVSGLIISVLLFLGVLLTILIGHLFVSVGVGIFWALSRGWWCFERSKPLARRYVWLSWLQAGAFAFRLMVEVSSWWTGQIAQLGVARLILGIPLFVLTAWLSWLGLRPFGQPVSQGSETQDEVGEWRTSAPGGVRGSCFLEDLVLS